MLFLVVIPLLAIFGNGISLKHEFDNKALLATMGVIIAPSVVILDKRVTNFEGAILIALYLGLLYMVQRKNGIFDKENQQLLNMKAYSYKDLLKIVCGLGIVFIASNLIVDKTMYFAQALNISAFYVSLIIVSLGTNLPELSLAVRSVVSGSRHVAMGDYAGSAAANTLLFGIFTLLHNGEVLTISNFIITFMFIAIALGLFYVFFRTRNYISRNNGFMLLAVYVLFIIFELMK